MKKLIITLFTLLLFVTGSYAQELNSKIKPANKEEIPKVSTFARMNDFTSFKAGDIVYDTNLEAHYQYLGDSTWILSDKFSPKKSSSYLAQLSSLSTLSGAPSLNATQAASGQVAFYIGASATDGNSNFVWDNTNLRLGIGLTSPQAPLEVVGQIMADSLKISGISIGRGRGSIQTNLAIGMNSLSLNTSGYHNTAIGNQSMNNNTTGYFNSAFGSNSLYFNGTGIHNTAMGYSALNSNSSSFNTAIGSQALVFNSTGNKNTAIGARALRNNYFGSQNTALGDSSFYSLNTGTNNIAIGYSAGENLTSGNNNIAIGTTTNFQDVSGNYQLNIGNEIYGKYLGDPNNQVQIGIGTDTPTTTLDINGSIRIRGGAPAAGKVLTSDANGNASWESAGGIYSGSGLIRQNTTVDLGTNSLSFFGIGGTSGKNVNIVNTSGDYNPAFRLISTSPSNGWNQSAQFMMPNMVNGGKNMIGFGKSWSKLNTAYLYYYHAGDASTNNQIRLGFHSSDDIVSIGANNVTSIKGKTFINNDNNDKATITATPGQVEFVIYLNIGTGNNQGLASQGITTNGYDLQFEGGKYEVTASLGLGGIFKQYVYPMNITIGYATDYISGTGVSDNKISFDFNTYTHKDGTHFDSGWKTFFPLNPQQKYRIFLTTYNRGGDKIAIDTLVVKFRRIG